MSKTAMRFNWIVCLVLSLPWCVQALAEDKPEPRPAAGEPVNGLKLTLSAEKTRLQMTELQLRRATADTPRYRCEPTALNLTFTNVSDKPIKLDTYDLVWSRVSIGVTGPGPDSVRAVPRAVEREMPVPTEHDFPVMKPGQSWSTIARFPGELGPFTFILLQPGRYQVKATYSRKADLPGIADGPKFAEDAWVGTVASNVVELNAALPSATQPAGEAPEFGPPVHGLRLGVGLSRHSFAPGEPVRPNVLLHNTADKPILVLPLLVHGATVHFDLTGPDGKKIPYRGPMLDWDVPDYDKAVLELAAGQTVSKELSLGGYDLGKPGKYTLTAVYQWSNAKPPPGRKPEVWTRGPIWVGTLRSGELVFRVEAQVPAGPGPDAPDSRQGIQGQVVKLAGDFMPGPGPARGTRSPLVVPVHVFRGKVKSVNQPDYKHPQLVKVVQSDKEGRFKVALPPGEYTVVAEIAGKLYLNIMTGDGCWATVNVEADKWTAFVIEDTSDATF